MRDIQNLVALLYKQYGFTNDLLTLSLGLCEEVGEIAKAVNYFTNPKYKRVNSQPPDSIEHELCDALVYLLGIANSLGVDLQTEMEHKLTK